MAKRSLGRWKVHARVCTRVLEVIPTTMVDDVVHVSVGEDDSCRGTPGPSQQNLSSSSDYGTFCEAIASAFGVTLPMMCCDSTRCRGCRVYHAPLRSYNLLSWIRFYERSWTTSIRVAELQCNLIPRYYFHVCALIEEFPMKLHVWVVFLAIVNWLEAWRDFLSKSL